MENKKKWSGFEIIGLIASVATIISCIIGILEFGLKPLGHLIPQATPSLNSSILENNKIIQVAPYWNISKQKTLMLNILWNGDCDNDIEITVDDKIFWAQKITNPQDPRFLEEKMPFEGATGTSCNYSISETEVIQPSRYFFVPSATYGINLPNIEPFEWCYEKEIEKTWNPCDTTINQIPTIISLENLGDNIITDGGFENGLGSWTYDSRHTLGIIYPTTGYVGNGVCSRQNLTENDLFGWVGIGKNINVEIGKTYKYSAWVKWENATQFGVHIEWNNPIEYDFFKVIDGYSNNWQYWEGTFTAPVNSLRLSFWHGVKNNNTNVPDGIICVDEVSLREVK